MCLDNLIQIDSQIFEFFYPLKLLSENTPSRKEYGYTFPDIDRRNPPVIFPDQPDESPDIWPGMPAACTLRQASDLNWVQSR